MPYLRSECAVFLKTDRGFGGLSNMAGGYPLVINDVTFRTSEALYQALRFPKFQEAQRIAFTEASPMMAKGKTKRFRPTHSRPDWNEVRLEVMYYCLRVKLARHRAKLGALLRDTGDRVIVEETTKSGPDSLFWGARAVNGQPEVLEGQNNLGILLMKLREELKTLSPTAMYRVEPLDIPDFLLFGEPVRRV
jgi:ribA/ribD-fused uncharacterized protein